LVSIFGSKAWASRDPEWSRKKRGNCERNVEKKKEEEEVKGRG
jgi:hypothetical protein